MLAAVVIVAGCALHVSAQAAAAAPSAVTGAAPDAAAHAAADPASRLQNRPDSVLARDVRSALRRAPALDASGIRVSARIGVVTLAGWVPQREQIARGDRGEVRARRAFGGEPAGRAQHPLNVADRR
ncbi:MAG TPA: BON domain-containing protein [Paraburkholderia sp.]|nr:BON domain-containing protein [Paraburkholderia sp.]